MTATVNLYKFKTPSKPTEKFAFELVDEFPTRTAARRAMNDKRHSDKEYRFAVYEGGTLLSSTF